MKNLIVLCFVLIWACFAAGDYVVPSNLRGRVLEHCNDGIRLKSHESICSQCGGCGLYANSNDVRTDKGDYTYWKHCRGQLIDDSSGRCLERFCCGDNYYEDEEDVMLATCDDHGKDQK